MPFSIVMYAYPQTDTPVAHVQGPALQGMFLELIKQVDPVLNERLHNDDQYRPYTLSPLAVGADLTRFDGFRIPREVVLRAGTPCALRLSLLVDEVFPTFSRYFLDRATPTVRLGHTDFSITDVAVNARPDTPWSLYVPYQDLVDRASQTEQHLTFRFLTPTTFGFGDVDMPLPWPRLVFQSFRRRFEEFAQVNFMPDFEAQVERYTAITNLNPIQTEYINIKNANGRSISFLGFTGRVTYRIHNNAAPDLIFQMNLLADYAMFCGTGKRTTVGMGQTIRVHN